MNGHETPDPSRYVTAVSVNVCVLILGLTHLWLTTAVIADLRRTLFFADLVDLAPAVVGVQSALLALGFLAIPFLGRRPVAWHWGVVTLALSLASICGPCLTPVVLAYWFTDEVKDHFGIAATRVTTM